jgi:hypothetical protein
VKDLEQKVVEIIDKLQDLAQPAMQMAITSIRINGILYLVAGLVCAGIFFIAAKICATRSAKFSKDDEGVDLAFALLSGVIALGFGIATCVNLLDPQNWLAAIRPDLYLATHIVNHVL